jgi:hypothetical protein
MSNIRFFYSINNENANVMYLYIGIIGGILLYYFGNDICLYIKLLYYYKKEKTIIDRIMIIQPLWNKYILNKHLSSYELRILERELIEYKKCDGDIEYFHKWFRSSK